ncbi:hypothetical protein GPECTOR_6g605 [Gonium pectorale]|uniref:ABC1 atypical kinase-like domain-containing protein n=1 Tax=Gonium pectorale TaxID=33097 RepID=A0A150GVH4_GONPE|nr:hypothetical protein GPECTOR_6g605 [Gonium pectorale]|eukprot:KXZ53688.1 hypothetical protein GPECTOR_6g605 [Gonium pectorale]
MEEARYQSLGIAPQAEPTHQEGTSQPQTSERIAVLNSLRDGTPIELEFKLERGQLPRLNAPAGEPPPVGITAISPMRTSRPRRQRRQPHLGQTAVLVTARLTAQRLRSLGGALHAVARGAAGRVGLGAATVASLAARGAAGGVAVAGGAAREAARLSVAAACLPLRATMAAARAGAAAGAAAAAQPARLGRLLVRLPGAPPLRALAGGARRGLRLVSRLRLRRPAGTAAAGTARTAAAAAAAAPTYAVHAVSELPLAPSGPEALLLRARTLAPAAARRSTAAAAPAAPPPSAPFEGSTAKPIPALLISGAAATAPMAATGVGGAGGSRSGPQSARPRAATAAAGFGRGRRLAAAGPLLRMPAAGLLLAARGASVAVRYGGVSLLCAFFPRSCRLPALAALLSGPHLPLPAALLGGAPLPNPLPPGPLRSALAPLGPLRRPFALFGAMRLLGPHLAPSLWRNLQYWQRAVPIFTRYLLTSRRASRLRSRGQHEAAEELWQRRHEAGAGAIFDMLADLKGFYLKLGQILASKTDMLPGPYTESLSRLCDRLPPTPYRVVRRTIRDELGEWPETLFRELDPFPLASATIAQVHRGRLPDGRVVVVKVQHPSARAAMAGDLANLRALSRLLGAAGLELGFDHRALVEEYSTQVPLEFDFVREARVSGSIRSSLAAASTAFPALRRVVVPACVGSHCGRRLLTMEYLDGVPLLDIAGMDLTLRHDLMTSLILAYGVMILRDGLFHTDPHPGNVLAMRRRASGSVDGGGRTSGAATRSHTHFPPSPHHPATPGGAPAPGSDADDVRVALLDFGQAKELSSSSRARYAMLVAAMAVRDDELVLEVSRELGLRVENCSPHFAAAATYILFDTRMDFPEAHQGPMHPEAHETARVPALPQDLFMIMRVITLLRGLLSSLRVDVSSAQLWRPLALQALADLTPVYRSPSPRGGGGAAAAQQRLGLASGGSGGQSPDAAALLAADLAAVDPLDMTAAFFVPSLEAPAGAARPPSGQLLPLPPQQPPPPQQPRPPQPQQQASAQQLPQAPAVPSAAAGSAVSHDLVAQALALLESTRRLVPQGAAATPASGAAGPAALASAAALAASAGAPGSSAQGGSAHGGSAHGSTHGSHRSEGRKKGGSSKAATSSMLMPYNAGRAAAQASAAANAAASDSASLSPSGAVTPTAAASQRPSSLLAEIEPASPAATDAPPSSAAAPPEAAQLAIGGAGSGLALLMSEDDHIMWLARNQARSPAASEIYAAAAAPTAQHQLSPGSTQQQTQVLAMLEQQQQETHPQLPHQQPVWALPQAASQPQPQLAAASSAAASSAGDSVNGGGAAGKQDSSKSRSSVKAGLTRLGKKLVGL